MTKLKTIYQCDECKKEMDEDHYRIMYESKLFYFNHVVWSNGEFISSRNIKDFCSKQCYQKWEKEEFHPNNFENIEQDNE